MKIGWKTCFKIGITVVAVYLCIYFFPNAVNIFNLLLGAVMPLIIGGAIAFVVNILMSFYERHYFPKAKKKLLVKSRRPICLVAAYLSVLAVIGLVIGLIVPQLVSCVTVIVSKVPSALNAVVEKLNEHHIVTEEIVNQIAAIDWKSRLEQIVGVVSSGLGDAFNIIVNTVSSVVSGVISAIIAIIFSVYLLVSKDKIRNQFDRVMKRFMKESIYKKTKYVLSVTNESFKKYISGQCIEAVILGVLCTLGMWILRLPYATMIGALIAFTALIPVAGAYIGGGIGAFMIFTESPVKALIFIVFLVVLQQIEGNLIYPRVVGSSMGLPGIWVLAAVTVGGGAMGVLGMLISVPIAATFYRLLKDSVNNPPKEKKALKE